MSDEVLKLTIESVLWLEGAWGRGYSSLEHFENKDVRACIRTLFETIFWNCRQKHIFIV